MSSDKNEQKRYWRNWIFADMRKENFKKAQRVKVYHDSTDSAESTERQARKALCRQLGYTPKQLRKYRVLSHFVLVNGQYVMRPESVDAMRRKK